MLKCALDICTDRIVLLPQAQGTKEKAGEYTQAAQHKAGEVTGSGKSNTGSATDTAKDYLGTAQDKAKSTADQAGSKVRDMMGWSLTRCCTICDRCEMAPG